MDQAFLNRLPASIRTIWLAFLHWWDDLVVQAAMSLIWCLSWLTIILGPPVTFGIHYVENQYVRGENPGLRGLWEGSLKYFVKSWVWMLVNLLVFALFLISANFYSQQDDFWAGAASAITLVMGVLWLTVQFYTIPFLMLQEKKSLREAWRNSLITTLASPGYLLVFLLFLLLFGLLSVILIFPTILGYITLLSILANQAVRDRMEVFQAMSAQNQTGPAGDTRPK